MKITFHVGPHKTGTTSLQSWMLQNSSAHLEEFGIYYPDIEKFPPGHAVIAWRALGLNNFEEDPESLRAIVDEGAARGANHVVFSSEEFSRGLTRATIENLRVLGDYGSLELILTLSSLQDRFLSEIGEQIKHAVAFDLYNVDVPGFCLSRPGLWPNIVDKLRDGVRPDKTHVILSNKDRPAVLIESFAQILGLPRPEQSARQNLGSSAGQTRLLNFVNAEFTDLNMFQRRELSAKLSAVIDKEGLEAKMRPIRFSEDATRFLTQTWDLQCDHLRALHQIGEIQLYGGASKKRVPDSESGNSVSGLSASTKEQQAT